MIILRPIRLQRRRKSHRIRALLAISIADGGGAEAAIVVARFMIIGLTD
jgi:hypothetical protein